MLIDKPLTEKQLKTLLKDGRITVDISVELGIIMDGIEAVNDLMDREVAPPGFMLNDISYQVVGSIPPSPETYIGGYVILRMNAEVEEA